MYKDIISKKGYKINIKEMLPEHPKEIIVAVHGFAGDKESSAITAVANNLNKLNIGVIALDLPGHGTSEVNGEYLTLTNCLDDINSIVDYAKSEYKLNKISLFATSFGAYLAIALLNKSKNNFNKVILRCPAIKMDEILVNEILNESVTDFEKRGYTVVGYERELKVNFSYYKELLKNKLNELTTTGDNILIIHGDSDTTAPTIDAINFAKKNNLKISIVKGADHRFKNPGELEQVIQLTTDFMKN